MKTKRIPFDINKAKAGAKIVTRNGSSVRITCTDVDAKVEGFTLLVLARKDGKELPYLCRENGKSSLDESKESDLDLFIEEEEEETDDYNPYKATVESIADMAERYSELQSIEELKDFYNEVKAKCREAVEYNWEDEKPADIFEIKPDKWYVCIKMCHSIDVIDFAEGHYYLGSDILKYGLLGKSNDYIDYFHPWTIKDAKPGDILATKNGYVILIFKNIKSSSGSGFSSYYNYNNFSDYSDFKEGSWNRDGFIPATKEQRDILFQKMKDAGYMWDSDKKELHKIEEVKKRRMTHQELSWWLRDCPEEHREYGFCDDEGVRYFHTYRKDSADKEVEKEYRIRRNGGEWQEPLVEI